MFFNEIFMEASPLLVFLPLFIKTPGQCRSLAGWQKTLLQRGFGKEVCEISGHRWMVQELSKAPDF
jgi:hypothetical protein